MTEVFAPIDVDQNRSTDEPCVLPDFESTGGYVISRGGIDRARRRSRSADRVVGASAGLLLVAVVGASAVLARHPSTAARVGWIAVWTLMTAAAVAVTAAVTRRTGATGSSRKPSRPARRRRRNAFLAVALVSFAGAAVVLLVFGWRIASVVPGVLSAAAFGVARHHRVHLRPTRATGWALVAVTALALVPLFSVEVQLTADGADPLSIRSVEWLRDNGGAWLVDAVENWWYTTHPPPVGGTPSTLPAAPSTVPSETTVPTPEQPAAEPVPVTQPEPRVVLAPVPTPAATPLPGEGQWAITAGTEARPAVAITFLRPDAIHTSVVVGIMRIDPSVTRIRLIPGTEQPGGPAPSGGSVPPEDRGALVAAFNSGFRMQDSKGGWYSEGQSRWPLRDGAASFMLRDDGRADVGIWGREITLDPHMTAVRQNLTLLVDGGQLVPGTDDASSHRWGGTVGNKILVNRSGIGITADGALVYVGGPAMSVQTLGQTLIAAGAVRAMELDINSAWVNAFTYAPGPNGPIGRKLIDAMPYSPDRYLRSQGRDFVSVTLAPPGV